MKKNDAGITMISMIVMIILLVLLAGVGINMGIDSAKTTKNNNLKTELGIVRQAIVEKYINAVTLGKIEENNDESFWLGTKIENSTEINVPEQSSIKRNNGADELYTKLSNYNCQYPEDFYYRLNASQLKELGVANAKTDAQYIVNYKTGEVYNEKIKKDSNSELLYLPSTNNNVQKTKDDVTFNDWN